jgi:hypothetical protein
MECDEFLAIGVPPVKNLSFMYVRIRISQSHAIYPGEIHGWTNGLD